MDIKATKAELKYLSDFQRTLHGLPGFSSLNEDGKSENFYSQFHKVYIKTTWYCSDITPLQNSSDGDIMVYKPINTYHYLLETYLKFTLPPIKVKEQYKDTVRICWCHNVGTNIIKNAIFKEDDLSYQTFDSVWFDQYFQFFMEKGAGKRKNHNIGIGNSPFVEEWSWHLPKYPINVDQPWFYGDMPSNAYPIFYRNSQSRAEHRYLFKNKISDLLRMQILDAKGWQDVVVYKHMDYLDYGKYNLIDNPTLWGSHAYITDQELKTYREKIHKKEIFIRDVEICDDENPIKYDQNSDIDLDCSSPCLALFWCAENQDAIKFNNYSNYTCNSDDFREGCDPISHTSLKYSNNYKFLNLESDHFNIAISRKHFSSSPSECGYHAYSFAWHSRKSEVGVTFYGLKCKLICKIANNDLFGENQEQKPEFITRVRLLVLKKLTIDKVKDDFQFTLQ